MFALPIRVYIEDTDAGGVVFYANYLKFYERARTELVRSTGYQLRVGLADNLSFVVSELAVKYRQPAKLDNILYVTAKVKKIGRASIVFEQTIHRGEDEKGFLKQTTDDLDPDKYELLSSAEIKVASLSLDTLKPCKLPEDLKHALEKFRA